MKIQLPQWDFASDPDFPTYGGGGAIYQEFADTLTLQAQLLP